MPTTTTGRATVAQLREQIKYLPACERNRLLRGFEVEGRRTVARSTYDRLRKTLASRDAEAQRLKTRLAETEARLTSSVRRKPGPKTSPIFREMVLVYAAAQIQRGGTYARIQDRVNRFAEGFGMRKGWFRNYQSIKTAISRDQDKIEDFDAKVAKFAARMDEMGVPPP